LGVTLFGTELVLQAQETTSSCFYTPCGVTLLGTFFIFAIVALCVEGSEFLYALRGDLVGTGWSLQAFTTVKVCQVSIRLAA
jgi:hypothetical protein